MVVVLSILGGADDGCDRHIDGMFFDVFRKSTSETTTDHLQLLGCTFNQRSFK